MRPPAIPTEVVPIDAAHPNPAVLARAAAVIRAGGLVAFPTETVYGLGAHALDARAVRRVFRAKERATDDPLIVHIAEPAGLEALVTGVPSAAAALARAFWPGPLTLVLPKCPAVPDEVTAGLPSVAVRVPAHPVAHGLLVAAGVPIAAPSANRFMRTSATTAAHVLEDLDGRIEMVLDGGPAGAGIESTVVAAEGGEVRILRPGALTREAIAAVLAELDPPVALAEGAGPGPQASPGMLAKHYAPRARLQLLPPDAGELDLLLAAASALARGETVGAALATEAAAALANWAWSRGPEEQARVHVEDLGPDLESAAHRLFAGLRALDAAGCTLILAREFPGAGLAAALNDRLRRAAG